MMDMEDYDHVVKNIYETELDNRVTFLKTLTVPIFNEFSMRQLYDLAKCLEKKSFRLNQGLSVFNVYNLVIVKQHQPGKYMYFILSGECKVLKQIETEEPITTTETKKVIKFLEVALLKPKEYFGELALLNHTPRMASVYAATNVTTLALGKIDFTRCMKSYD
jgi:CRP-like cAMP-binding protein